MFHVIYMHVRPVPTRSAYHGKQFLVNGQKWGKQTPDCYIDKDYKRLSEVSLLLFDLIERLLEVSFILLLCITRSFPCSQ